ncbi:MAG: hypothetical protein HXS54_01315 [Theionarchaea archaeon]|nr:hypothetical protein [Theionarchaea archaeon]
MKIMSILSWIGIVGSGGMIIYTILDLFHMPYWTVSVKLLIFNALYFFCKFTFTAFVFSIALKSLFDIKKRKKRRNGG